MHTIKDGLTTIKMLNPVAFRYTQEYMDKHPSLKERDYHNFIAQEFQNVFPDYVRDSGEDDILQIDTGAVRPHMVAAIQELADMMDELREENKTLRERIRKLERDKK